MTQRVLFWPRVLKQTVVLVLDVVLALVSTWLAFGLRFDVWARPIDAQWYVYGLAPLLAVPIFVKFGLYRAVFRYTGQAALNATAKAMLLYAFLLTVVLLTQRWQGVPRTLGVLQPLIFLMLIGLSRALARFWLAGIPLLGNVRRGNLLIYGAGTAGVQTALALQVSGGLKLVGFVDDDALKVGRSIHHLPIFAPRDLLGLVARHNITGSN